MECQWGRGGDCVVEHRSLTLEGAFASSKLIGGQGRGACEGPVPHPPFELYVRFSRIQLTDGLLDMVTLPLGIE